MSRNISKQETDLCLDDFIRSDYFAAWDASNRDSLGCSRYWHSRDRCDRIYEAAEHGAEGSTHGEIIQDWRDAFDCFQRDVELSEETIASIEKEIDECEAWHDENGSLDTQLG